MEDKMNKTKEQIGYDLAQILMLREDRGYNPKRFKTTWGNKTELGIYETIKRIIEDKDELL
jgi:hypothetical protein